jgi:hypothetical protein
MTEATDWLKNIHDEIKQLQGTLVGPTTEDGNLLLEKYEVISVFCFVSIIGCFFLKQNI